MNESSNTFKIKTKIKNMVIISKGNPFDMNIDIFGKIIAGIGILFLLLGTGTVIATTESIMSKSEWAAWAKQYSQPRRHFSGIQLKRRNPGSYALYKTATNISVSAHRACAYSRFGKRDCPMGGYSAVFTYLGLLIAGIGGALVLASRKPDQAAS